ncbi:MAG: SMP-30/gluconolactonase/LRE family protein [Candidatus Hydrogenedentes bacterium]|nr:SMP-30/gluconolactonase/LRE family protein [Candidatus Hydrogenedentota bacterium]
MARKILMAMAALIILLVAYLLAWPVGIDPAAWQPPAAPKLAGVYAPNTYLATAERLGEGVGPKPEDIAVDTQGRIYGGFEDGRIMRWAADLATHEVFADTGGRPLGLHFDAQQNLIVADSYKGLLSVDPAGKIAVLTTGADGLPFGFTDDVEIAKDGTIYFSDASWKYGQMYYREDIVEHQPNGRLLAYSPVTKETRVLLKDLYFANGVAVAPDQTFVLVVETGAYRVQRYWIAGAKKGEHEIFIENLPGFPDGISSGENGIFWMPFPSLRNPLVDRLMPHPFLRKVIMRLPRAMQPNPQRYSFLVGLDQTGAVVHNLHDPNGKYAPITSVQEHQGMLYLGSIEENAFARVPVPKP